MILHVRGATATANELSFIPSIEAVHTLRVKRSLSLILKMKTLKS